MAHMLTQVIGQKLRQDQSQIRFFPDRVGDGKGQEKGKGKGKAKGRGRGEDRGRGAGRGRAPQRERSPRGFRPAAPPPNPSDVAAPAAAPAAVAPDAEPPQPGRSGCNHESLKITNGLRTVPNKN